MTRVRPDGRRALVELVLLERYDDLRASAGHDYGAGQRAAELSRRRRALGDRERFGAPVHRDELALAFERIGRPRLARLERDAYRAGTPAGRRSLDAWRRLARELGVELEPAVDRTAAMLAELTAERVAAGRCRHCGGPVPCWSPFGDVAVGVRHGELEGVSS